MPSKLPSKLLIANRGEIAVRIIRTCKRLKIKTVAIYSEADRGHPHTLLADEAICIGPAPASESYLHTGNITATALRVGADAIHPGYGFLSENAEFAAAVETAGITFIGPTPETLRILGEKQQARELARKLAIPIPPGYSADDQTPARLIEEAKRLGFPVMIKAVAGGGGRGMRKIESAEGFSEAIESARREAAAAFGNGTLFLEKIVFPARHIEVQVLGNGNGKVIHLFERECSLQRRFQKLIEEAPAPYLEKAIRKKILAVAVTLAASVKLRGAATCEFLVPWSKDGSAQEFFFLEANPRLQVEHPVTEAITRLDLVELQLRAVCDHKIPRQSSIHQHGHSIEARVYAEMPNENFTPSTGRILSYTDLSDPSQGVRVDHGLGPGISVSSYYDALLAKVITHAKSRGDALVKLQAALTNLGILGVDTNIPFLQAILADTNIQHAPPTTTYLDEYRAQLLSHARDGEIVNTAKLAAVVLPHVFEANFRDTPLPYFRPGQGEFTRIAVHYPARDFTVSTAVWPPPQIIRTRILGVTPHGENLLYEVELDGSSQSIRVIRNDAPCCVKRLLINGREWLLHARKDDETWHFAVGGFYFSLEQRNATKTSERKTDQDAIQIVLSSLPGVIIKIEGHVGSSIEANDLIAVLESMKMEHGIYAASAGTIAEVHVAVGQTVRQGDAIASVRPLQSPPA